MLFNAVDIKFTPGNCYGLIGANGAGKSTFLKVLAGTQEPTSGSVKIPEGLRISTLEQNHFAYEEVEALDAVMMGHEQLFAVRQEKDALYAKPDFSEEDGMRSAELETLFADLGGWDADAAAAKLLCSLGIETEHHNTKVKDLEDDQKVRVLLAKALFGDPDILLLDEPTNHLDVDSILWLEDFLLDFKNTAIVVSHDRHFLDRVVTHIADVDFQKVTLFSGNYTFWYETSQMALRQRQEANRKKEARADELKAFIRRFSANASKSKQATSRKALLDKITLDDIKPSSRKYPYIRFETTKPLGNEVLTVDRLTLTSEGTTLFRDLSFTVGKDERIALVGNDVAVSALCEILAGKLEPDSGSVKWGRTAEVGYFPKDNATFFDTDDNLIEWLAEYSEDQAESFVRGFLGRMLFSGDDVKKSARVLSGGEKVRCMLARMMLQDPNVLLMDGPTNHLDLESITALNNGLLDFKGMMIFACHDVKFVSSLADRIIELDGGAGFDLRMDYDEYLVDEARLARVHRDAA